jgi:tRNA pseudouridine38-40 synthase
MSRNVRRKRYLIASDQSEYRRNAEIMPGGELPSGMMRYALAVEYRGDRYHGWQRLAGRHEPTVQAALEQALSFVAAEAITVVCAGRTDAGVHATNQIVHFDTVAERDEKAWVLGVNSQLPTDIRVRWARPVAAEFHARFSARARTYRYLIANTPSQPAIAREQCLWVRKPLDVSAMQTAANFCLGEHDFSSVRGASCQAKSPVRTLHTFTVAPVQNWLVVELCGNAFLHHMVRNLMGLLLPVGVGNRHPEWVRDILALRDRKQAGKTEAPGALYLVKVDYDRDYGFPLMEKGPFMLPDTITAV